MNRTDEPGEPPNRQQAHNSQRKEKTSMNKKNIRQEISSAYVPFFSQPAKGREKTPRRTGAEPAFFWVGDTIILNTSDMQLSPIQNFFCNCAYEILLNQKNEVKKKKSRGAISAEKIPSHHTHKRLCIVLLFRVSGRQGGKKTKRYIYIIYIYIFFFVIPGENSQNTKIQSVHNANASKKRSYKAKFDAKKGKPQSCLNDVFFKKSRFCLWINLWITLAFFL